MTIPSRPAPPPPNKLRQNQQHNGASSMSTADAFVNQRKPAPPRPPPPRANAPAMPSKKMGLLSNIFGSRNKATTESASHGDHTRVPPKLPAPPITMRLNLHHHQQHQQTVQQSNHILSSIHQINNDLQLIELDDTKSYSPTPMIKKSNTGGSDSVSIDSFCSSASSPNLGGAVSQSERWERTLTLCEFQRTMC